MNGIEDHDRFVLHRSLRSALVNVVDGEGRVVPDAVPPVKDVDIVGGVDGHRGDLSEIFVLRKVVRDRPKLCLFTESRTERPQLEQDEQSIPEHF